MNYTDTKYLLFSIAGHLSLLLLIMVKILAFPNVRPALIRSVRVDFVALPDKLPSEAPVGVEKEHKLEDAKVNTPAPPPPPKPEPMDKKKVTDDKTLGKEKMLEPKKETTVKKEDNSKDQQSSAVARLQALSKIKKLKEKKDGPEGTTYKGNTLSAGSSLTGVEKLQHDQYMENLDVHIRRYWQLPEWLAKKQLTAALLVKFNEQGLVLERRFIRSSGSEQFDKEVMQTIDAASPLPPPPESLISYFKVYGIELRFPE